MTGEISIGGRTCLIGVYVMWVLAIGGMLVEVITGDGADLYWVDTVRVGGISYMC